MERTDSLFRNWSKGRFDQTFQIDGIPLWSILQYRLYSSLIPKPFRILKEIETDFEKYNKPTVWDNIHFKVMSFAFRKYLMLNEYIKRTLSNKPITFNSEKGVLFIEYFYSMKEENGNIKLLKSDKIFNKLLDEGVANPILILCDPISRNSLFKLNDYYTTIYGYIDGEVMRESNSLADKFSHMWKKIPESDKEKLVGFLYPYMKNELNLLFSKEILSLVIRYHLAFKKVIKQNNVEIALIETISGLYTIAIVCAMKSLGKKVILVPHGGDMRTHIAQEFADTIIPVVGTPRMKNDFANMNIWNYESLGSPMLDELIQHRDSHKTKEVGKTKTILFPTTDLISGRYIDKETYFQYVAKFVKEITSFENARLVIKLHPREKNRKEYEEITKGYNNVEIVQDNLYEHIHDSDLVVVTGSFSGIEALIYGKPVVYIEGFLDGLDYAVYEENHAVTKVHRDGNLKLAVASALNDYQLSEKANKYLSENFYQLDGKAYERIANLIYDKLK